jgi:hypothetical protein
MFSIHLPNVSSTSESCRLRYVETLIIRLIRSLVKLALKSPPGC